MLHYRVLGPVSVERDGEVVAVGGARQRRLLAALLIHRNHVVSDDVLVEVVFAGDPSPRAAATLRTYVSRLRTALDAADTIERVGVGYRFSAADDAIDAACFLDEAARARRVLAYGDPPGALALLRQALGRWRGDPFEEFADESWAQPEAHRLAEARNDAREAVLDAELASGRAGEVVSQLEGLVVEEPWRDGFHERLALALYRSGRPADALAALRRHRDRLVEELGLDPSPALVELEERILVHDETLSGSPTAGRPLRGWMLGERLGSGRVGTVFAARRAGADRDVVVRVYPAGVADDAQFVRRFEPDVRRVATLEHPAIVAVLDAWREPGAAALVTPRYDGGTLADRLPDGLSVRDRITTIGRVGGALVACASRGVRHGNVCPRSVLFDDDGRAHLADFAVGGVPAPLRDDVDAFLDLVVQLGFGIPDLPEARLVDATGAADWQDRLQTVVERVMAEVAGGGTQPVGNPYVGLRAFDRGDSDRFFGRGAVVRQLLSRLEGSAGPRLTLLVGGSGTGKSSVVRAGLVPALPAGWVATVLAPGATPFKELRAALERVATREPVPDAGRLRADPQDTAAWLGDAVPPDTRVLVVVDQFEEVFTLASPDDQTSFLDVLVALASAPDSPAAVVATLRADYFDRPLTHPSLAPLVADATMPLPAMTVPDLAAAITGPAGRLSIEPALVAELVDAVADRPGALPALQFTLYQLADRADGRLSRADLVELGGVDGAIASRAEQLYASASAEEQAVVRLIFEQLVVVEPTGDPERRRATRAELVASAGPGQDPAMMVERWVGARLLASDRDPETRDPTVEIAHEALLDRWPRLREWIDADRDWLRTLAGLRRAAATWDELHRDPGALLRGTSLDRALEGIAAHPAAVVPPAVAALVEASRARHEEEQHREAAIVAQREQANRNLRRQRRRLVAALVVALVVGGLAVERQVAASRSAAAADARARAATTGVVAAADEVLQSDWPLALLLGVEAFRLDDSDLTRRGLLNVLTTPRPLPDTIHAGDRGYQVVAPHDGVVVAKGVDGFVEARDATDGTLLFAPFVAPVRDRFNGLSLSDELVAASGMPIDGNGVVVHDVTTGARVFDLPARDGESVEVAFSPDGDRLAVTGQGRVRIVDVASRQVQVLTTESDEQVVSLAWEEDGSGLYAGGFDGGLWAWELEGGAGPESQARIPPGRTADLPLVGPTPVVAIALLPDQARLVVATFEGGAFVLDAASLRVEEGPLQDGPVTGLAVSPDGSRMAVAAFNRVPVWELHTDARSERQVTLVADAVDVAFADDGTLVTGGLAGDLVAWDLDPPSPVLETIPDAAPGIPTVSPDGTTLAMAGAGAGVRLFDLSSRRPTATLALEDPETSSMGGVAFTPGADRVVTTRCRDVEPTADGPCDGVVEAWDANTGVRAAGPESMGPMSPWIYAAVAVSDDGELVALGRNDARVEIRRSDSLDLVATLDALATGAGGFVTMLDFSTSQAGLLVATTADAAATWDVTDPSFPVVAEAGPVGITAAFTPDDLLVTSSQEGSVALRSRDFEVVDEVTGLEYPVYRPTFTADGELMASVDDFVATVRLWRLDDLGLLAGPIPGPGGVVAPDGQGLVVGFDPVTWLPLDPDRWVVAACDAAGRNLTRDEWDTYLDGEPWRETCPGARPR